MTPEMALVKLLSGEEKEKVASSFESMSVSELERIVRSEMKAPEPSIEELFKVADQWGRELAKTAAIPGMGMLRSGLGRAMHSAVSTPLAARAAVGAGVGAAGGALKAPDQNGSRMGNIVSGAGIGAGVGAGARAAATRLGSMNNAVGKTLGGGLTAAAKKSGNLGAAQAGKEMAVTRGVSQKQALSQKAKAQAGKATVMGATVPLKPVIPST